MRAKNKGAARTGEQVGAPSELARLRAENARLRSIALDLQPCARRYADERRTYVPGMVNDATRYLLSIGLPVNPCGERIIWARDGMGRAYDGLTDAQATPGTPEAMGGQPPPDPEWPPPLVLRHAPATAPAVLRLTAELDAGGRLCRFTFDAIEGADPAAAAQAAYRIGTDRQEAPRA